MDLTSHFSDFQAQILARLIEFWQGFYSAMDWFKLIELILLVGLLWLVLKNLPRAQADKISGWLIVFLILILTAEVWHLSILLMIATGLLLVLTFAFIFFNLDMLSSMFHIKQKMFNAPVVKLRTVISEIIKAGRILSANQVAGLIAIFPARVNLPKSFLRAGKLLDIPVTAESVIETFRDDKTYSSQGALIIQEDRIVAVGSGFGSGSAKRLVMSAKNPIILQIAQRYGAVMIISSNNSNRLVVVNKNDVYQQVTPDILERLLNNLLLTKDQ